MYGFKEITKFMVALSKQRSKSSTKT